MTTALNRRSYMPWIVQMLYAIFRNSFLHIKRC